MGGRRAVYRSHRFVPRPVLPLVAPLCDEHVGMLYPPRCAACDAAAVAAVLTVCELHPAHLMPCDKCEVTPRPG